MTLVITLKIGPKIWAIQKSLKLTSVWKNQLINITVYFSCCYGSAFQYFWLLQALRNTLAITTSTQWLTKTNISNLWPKQTFQMKRLKVYEVSLTFTMYYTLVVLFYSILFKNCWSWATKVILWLSDGSLHKIWETVDVNDASGIKGKFPEEEGLVVYLWRENELTKLWVYFKTTIN